MGVPPRVEDTVLLIFPGSEREQAGQLRSAQVQVLSVDGSPKSPVYHAALGAVQSCVSVVTFTTSPATEGERSEGNSDGLAIIQMGDLEGAIVCDRIPEALQSCLKSERDRLVERDFMP